MNTQLAFTNDEQVKDEIINLFLVSLGEGLLNLMNDADFNRIRLLKNGIDAMFDECDKAIFQAKTRAASYAN